MSSDPNDHPSPPEAGAEPAEPAHAADPAAEKPTASAPDQGDDSTTEGKIPSEPGAPGQSSPESAGAENAETAAQPRRRILIGSQRDPAAYRPRPGLGSVRIVGLKRRTAGKPDKPEASPPAPVQDQTPPAPELPDEDDSAARDEVAPVVEVPSPSAEMAGPEVPGGEAVTGQAAVSEPAVGRRYPPPNIRDRLPPELEQELEEALADAPLEELITGGDEVTKQPMLETDSRHTGRVVMIRRDDVFVDLGGREQGILPAKQFDEPPELGGEVRVRVVRYDPDEGIYELARMGAATGVADWADLEEGMLVEARVTGHNSGGLECEVGRIRGFIPVSQISLYRVEGLAEFVDQKFTCLVTEANPRRRNLVLSRRAVLEREQEEARRNLLESLEPGQVREGVVRKLVDFGAFVDLGGVDGLVHISQLAWGRVHHPREVLHEGQHIKVKVQSVDKQTAKISLAYRDLLENPWADAETKYPVTSTVHGKVTKLREYGAFVELELGVEGLVHISQLSHKRVRRVSDVVKEGDEVDAVVLSIDTEAQRISLSMKDLVEEPKPPEGQQSPEAEQPPPPPKRPQKPSKPLQGGLGRSSGGDKFGLNW